MEVRTKTDRTWLNDYITFFAKDLQVLSMQSDLKDTRHEWGGASIRMSPGTPILCCSSTAWKMRRDGPALKICPNHLNLRKRIALTRSKLHVACRASCGMVWPVKRSSILLLTSLIIFMITGFGIHDSHPYDKIEQTAAWYSVREQLGNWVHKIRVFDYLRINKLKWYLIVSIQ